jgi:hypothetical protein
MNDWLILYTWGPRYLIPIIPLLLLPIGAVLEHPRWRGAGSAGFACLFVVSIAAQVPAVTTSIVKPHWQALLAGIHDEEQFNDWRYFRVARQYQHMLKSIKATPHAERFEVRPQGPREEVIERMLALNVINWWWILVFDIYGTSWIFLVPVIGLGGIIRCGWQLRHLIEVAR